jgi:hypothetical protein
MMNEDHLMRLHRQLLYLQQHPDISDSHLASLERAFEKRNNTIRAIRPYEYCSLFFGLLFCFLSIRKKEPVFHSVPILAFFLYLLLSLP